MRTSLATATLATLAVLTLTACTQQSPTQPTLFEDGGSAFTGEAKLPKVDICHVTGNGKYVFINVSGNALPAHLAHGDSLPGENGLNAECVVAFVEFIAISVGFPGEVVEISWTVDGTSDPVTYCLEGFDAFGAMDWVPADVDPIVLGTGQGDYSGIDTFFWDLYRVRAVDGDGNEVISPEVSPF